MSEIEEMMDEDLKQIYTKVKEKLIEHNNTLNDINPLDELSQESVEYLIDSFYLHPNKEFREQMKNLFAIAKFMILTNQQNEVIERIETDLNNTFDKNKVTWTVYENFKNEICFTKNQAVNSDEKPQALLIKYRIDPIEDQIIYSLTGGYWGYDITKEQLKALLEGEIPTTGNYKQTDFSFNVNKDNLFVNVNGIQISIKKQ